MNTDLRKMIVQAECRHLTETEMARLRDYASGMEARLQAMRRLEAAETEIVELAWTKLAEGQAAYVAKTHDVRTTTMRDLATTLRYVGQAHVRDDAQFFRRNYVEWSGPLLKATTPREVLVEAHDCLVAALATHLDPSDTEVFRRYLDMFAEELRA